MASVAHQGVARAVHRHRHLSRQGLLERAFTFAFRGLVYAQIWEDPVVDMEALAITPDCHVVTIASGGCNMLSYLTADPRRITAVDLNTAHVALGRLKLAAARALPDHAAFHRFFAQADCSQNIAAYRAHVAPLLDDATRRYWEGRDLIGRRRIGGFARGIYKRGLLGGFIGAAHLLARVHGVDLRRMLAARTIEEQKAIYDAELAPLFDRAFVRWLTSQPASLFGLGIPPAQFDALAGDEPMDAVLKARLEKLACGFALKDNYFARQAFGRCYGQDGGAALPPYLEARNHEAVAARAGRVDVRHVNMVDFLKENAAGSLDRYVLLDAQDWMDNDQLNALWGEITRTARPGARVLFRTAGEPSILPGRVRDDLLGRWRYEARASRDYTAHDRSAIYGGVHLYVLERAM
ncbi:DUF3419 family protein [Sphingobium sp. AN641]|uniref:DUF3419 family protein n=1 Tax=Sphingobium sp. AN641 TaxID=3133443 RepID=UPI0030BA9E70